MRRLVEVDPGEPGPGAGRAGSHKDPALVELVLAESTRVVRAERGVLITETRDGWVCANAGIDSSNLDEGLVSLLPVDSDASARRIRAEIREADRRLAGRGDRRQLRSSLESGPGRHRDRLRGPRAALGLAWQA